MAAKRKYKLKSGSFTIYEISENNNIPVQTLKTRLKKIVKEKLNINRLTDGDYWLSRRSKQGMKTAEKKVINHNGKMINFTQASKILNLSIQTVKRRYDKSPTLVMSKDFNSEVNNHIQVIKKNPVNSFLFGLQ